MSRGFLKLAHMILFGLRSFRLYKVHRRRHYVIQRRFLTTAERWEILGNRLRKAAEKVVGKNERG